MSETENGRQKTKRLDVAIDRAVREMLDVEPPAGLRGRVLDRISNSPEGSAAIPVASPFRRKGWRKAWLLAPIAAAAVIVLAVMLPWRGAPRISNPSQGQAPAPRDVTTTPPSPQSTTPPSAAPPQPTAATPPPVTVAARRTESRPIRAAVADDAAVGDMTRGERAQVAALDGPPPLVIHQLTGPASSSMRSIDVAPIRVAALEVNALSDLSRERQHEE
jgi:negative regulator of sigma E activity